VAEKSPTLPVQYLEKKIDLCQKHDEVTRFDGILSNKHKKIWYYTQRLLKIKRHPKEDLIMLKDFKMHGKNKTDKMLETDPKQN